MFKGSLPWQHPLAPKLREMILKGDWQPNEFEAHVFQKLLNESGNSEDHSRLKAIAEKITNLVANCLQIDPEKRFDYQTNCGVRLGSLKKIRSRCPLDFFSH